MTGSAEAHRSEPGRRASWTSRLFRRRGARGSSARSASRQTATDPAVLARGLEGATAQTGETLRALTDGQPRLVVFLRHLGCIFCRETLAELARARERIGRRGVGIVLVHLARDDRRADGLFAIYGLADLPRISDPERHLYRAVGLGQGRAGDLFGPHVLARAVEATCRGHLPGRSGGDTRQMPGVFLIHRGRILAEYRHRTTADRPDYVALADRVVETRSA